MVSLSGRYYAMTDYAAAQSVVVKHLLVSHLSWLK